MCLSDGAQSTVLLLLQGLCTVHLFKINMAKDTSGFHGACKNGFDMVKNWLFRLRCFILPSDFEMEWACLLDLVHRMTQLKAFEGREAIGQKMVTFLASIYDKRHKWCRAFMKRSEITMDSFTSNFAENSFSVVKKVNDLNKVTALHDLLEAILNRVKSVMQNLDRKLSDAKVPSSVVRPAVDDVVRFMYEHLHARPARAFAEEWEAAEQIQVHRVSDTDFEIVPCQSSCGDANARSPSQKLSRKWLQDLEAAEVGNTDAMQGLHFNAAAVGASVIAPHKFYLRPGPWRHVVKLVDHKTDGTLAGCASVRGDLVCRYISKVGESATCKFADARGSYARVCKVFACRHYPADLVFNLVPFWRSSSPMCRNLPACHGGHSPPLRAV